MLKSVLGSIHNYYEKVMKPLFVIKYLNDTYTCLIHKKHWKSQVMVQRKFSDFFHLLYNGACLKLNWLRLHYSVALKCCSSTKRKSHFRSSKILKTNEDEEKFWKQKVIKFLHCFFSLRLKIFSSILQKFENAIFGNSICFCSFPAFSHR